MTIAKDTRLNPTHISLYMALFNYWNINRFPKDFIIIRDEVMKLSKIGSKSTYHRCLKQLDSWKYIQYIPSHNSFRGSRIRLFIFGTTSGQPLDSAVPNQGQPLVSYINNNKHKENIYKLELPQNEKEVISFFLKNNWPKIEAQKFFAHYSAIGWKIGGKIKMTNWHASAKSWMLKSKDLSLKQIKSPPSQNQDNLKTTKSKNYKEPL
ncbi:hypothetical protein [Aequorivita sinensis]|uniref:hypothetical protein n=1 Tax=Aequorivita sinensis TaxID=1382458 RepID=UPI002300F51D|nr:hypothetical protein [Aequorivita sinensis]